jgi:hypothetical protein
MMQLHGQEDAAPLPSKRVFKHQQSVLPKLKKGAKLETLAKRDYNRTPQPASQNLLKQRMPCDSMRSTSPDKDPHYNDDYLYV